MTAIQISDKAEEKLKELKLAYKRKHETNITYQMMIAKLLDKAKLKDIE